MRLSLPCEGPGTILPPPARPAFGRPDPRSARDLESAFRRIYVQISGTSSSSGPTPIKEAREEDCIKGSLSVERLRGLCLRLSDRLRFHRSSRVLLAERNGQLGRGSSTCGSRKGGARSARRPARPRSSAAYPRSPSSAESDSQNATGRGPRNRSFIAGRSAPDARPASPPASERSGGHCPRHGASLGSTLGSH
jgi:hypothetical protein